MARALSIDLRERVLAAVDGGMSCRKAADRFGVSASSAVRWHDRWRWEGEFGREGTGRGSPLRAHRGLCRIDPLAGSTRNRTSPLPSFRPGLQRRTLGRASARCGASSSGAGSTRKKRPRTPPSRKPRSAQILCSAAFVPCHGVKLPLGTKLTLRMGALRSVCDRTQTETCALARNFMGRRVNSGMRFSRTMIVLALEPPWIRSPTKHLLLVQSHMPSGFAQSASSAARLARIEDSMAPNG